MLFIKRNSQIIHQLEEYYSYFFIIKKGHKSKEKYTKIMPCIDLYLLSNSMWPWKC